MINHDEGEDFDPQKIVLMADEIRSKDDEEDLPEKRSHFRIYAFLVACGILATMALIGLQS